MNQICPELEICNILFIVGTRLLLQFPLLRPRYKRLRIRGKDIKQSIHSTTVQLQYLFCNLICKFTYIKEAETVYKNI